MSITYTEEMKTQDALHATQSEDKDIMLRLHNNIVSDAQRQGFTGIVTTQIAPDDGEVLTAVFVNAAHRNDVASGNALIDDCATCSDLIEALEVCLDTEHLKVIEQPTQSGLRIFTLIDMVADAHLEVEVIQDYPDAMMALDKYTGTSDPATGAVYYSTSSLKDKNKIYYYKVIEKLK